MQENNELLKYFCYRNWARANQDDISRFWDVKRLINGSDGFRVSETTQLDYLFIQ